jgi:hypothetical protein
MGTSLCGLFCRTHYRLSLPSYRSRSPAPFSSKRASLSWGWGIHRSRAGVLCSTMLSDSCARLGGSPLFRAWPYLSQCWGSILGGRTHRRMESAVAQRTESHDRVSIMESAVAQRTESHDRVSIDVGLLPRLRVPDLPIFIDTTVNSVIKRTTFQANCEASTSKGGATPLWCC